MEIYLSLPNWVDEWLIKYVVIPKKIPFVVYCTKDIAEPIEAKQIVTIDSWTHTAKNVTYATALQMEKNYQMIDRAENVIIFYSIHYSIDVRLKDVVSYCESKHKAYKLYSLDKPATIVLANKTAVFGPKEWGVKEELMKFKFVTDDEMHFI